MSEEEMKKMKSVKEFDYKGRHITVAHSGLTTLTCPPKDLYKVSIDETTIKQRVTSVIDAECLAKALIDRKARSNP